MSNTNLNALSLQTLKQYLNIAAQDTTQDDFLLTLIESCTQAAEAYLGRIIVARAVIEEPHDAEDNTSQYLQLNHYPAHSVQNILQDGIVINLKNIKLNKQNGILKKSGPWLGAVLVSYTAGLCQSTEETPKNIQLALCQWIADMLAQQQGGVKSESLGDYSVTYYDDAAPLPPSTQTLLEAYKKVNL